MGYPRGSKWNVILLLVQLVMTSIFMEYSGANEENVTEEQLQEAVRKVKAVTSIADKMAGDEGTKSFLSTSAKNLGTKITNVKTKFTETVKLTYQKDPEGNAERIAGAVTGIGSAVGPIVSSIKNKDWKEGVKGALDLMSSVAALAGPKGMIVSAVLSFISSLFDLFGGSETTESMETKIEKIVSEQIDAARRKDLEEDVEGFKVSYQSLSASIRQFREAGQLSEKQANELYNHAFMELPVFGKLKVRVNELCDDVKKYEDATKCLQILNMYADLSVVRQLMLTEMAALMADVHEREHGVYAKGLTDGESSGLLAVSNNVLNFIKNEQDKDRDFFSFMTDPFIYPPRRYIISVFFSNPAKYSTVQAYIRSFKNPDNSNVFKDYVMICKEPVLQGTCFTLKKGYNPNLANYPKGWSKAIRSFYLPLGLQLYAWYGTEERGNKWGPYAGPIAHSHVSADKIFQSLKILGTIRDADKEVRFCEKEGLGEGVCDTANPGKYNLERYHGHNWSQKVRSMYISQGLNVKGFTESGEGGTAYIPYVGPFTVNRVWDENNWKSLTVDTTDGDARERVQVCDEPDFKGHCVVTIVSSNQLNHLGGTNFELKVKSLRIPGGVSVTGYTEHNKEGTGIGPYTGPASITRVDDGTMWKSMLVVKFGSNSNGRK